MRATFEHHGTIIDIGNRLAIDELDTTGTMGSSPSDGGSVAIGIYQRALGDEKTISYRSGFFMKPSEARAMASAILSAATEAKQ